MPQDLTTAFAAFASTNVDDFLVLIFLFSRGIRFRTVVLGQYLGFLAILLLSLLCALFAQTLPRIWIGLLGLVPVTVGILALARRGSNGEAPPINDLQLASRLKLPLGLGIAVLTFSNGADNVGVYAPLFVVRTPRRIAAMIVIFLILLGGLCLLSHRLNAVPKIASSSATFARQTMPWVVIGIGIAILWKFKTWLIFLK